jgi:hypothetical protein
MGVMWTWIKANSGSIGLFVALLALILVFYHHHDHAEKAVYLGA